MYIAELEARFDAEKSRNSILLLYLRHHRLKSINEQMLLQQKLLRTQLNPHFIFNSLRSIQSTIINKEPDKAIRYLSRFSKLIRKILDGSLTENVSSAEELATIETSDI